MEVCWDNPVFYGKKASIIKAVVYVLAVVLTAGMLLDMIGREPAGVGDAELPTGKVLDEISEMTEETEMNGRIAPEENRAGGGTGSMLTAEIVPGKAETSVLSVLVPEMSVPEPVKTDTVPEDSMAPDASGGEILNPSPIAVGAGKGEAANLSPAAPGASKAERVNPSPSVPDVSVGDTKVPNPVLPSVPDVSDAEISVPGPGVPDIGLPDSTDSTGAEEPAGVSAFLVDDAGMIYGFAPENAIIDDGVLELPKEGCNGIRNGAFAGCSAEIIELYVPANISVIEEGAFAGLEFLEWMDVEAGNPGYISIDGVLFDSSGTVLTAFPNGRTGAYIIPAEVTRIADGAFANTSLSELDMRACGEIVVGNDVFGERAGDGVEIAAPNEYLEIYRSAFGQYAVSIRFM